MTAEDFFKRNMPHREWEHRNAAGVVAVRREAQFSPDEKKNYNTEKQRKK